MVSTSVLGDYPDPAVPELSYQLGGLGSHIEVLDAALEMLARLIRCDALGWNDISLLSRRVEVYGTPVELNDPKVAEVVASLDDHPMITGYLGEHPWPDAKPRRVSDVIDRSSFHRTRTYNELFRLLGVEHQLVVMTSLAPPLNGRGWAFVRSSRDPDFGDADVSLASSVQLVLAAADRGVLARAVALPSDDGGDAAARLHLTVRELEMLRYVGAGLKADAIGHLLRISGRTVRKHLENAYRKLGCHDRLLAVQYARALGLLEDLPTPGGPGGQVAPLPEVRTG